MLNLGVWKNKDTQVLLVKMKTGRVTLGNSSAWPSKVEYVPILRPMCFTLGYKP